VTYLTFAVLAAAGYFLVFGAGFVFRPELISRLGLAPIRNAGRTEVRCYYGLLSWGIAGFLGWMLSRDLGREALVLVLFLASAVLIGRIVGTIVDDARDDPYTRVAIPTETVFVFVLAISLAITW
jgi:hypothetical protein